MKHMSKGPHELRFAVLAADTVLLSVRDRKICVRLIPVHLPPHFSHLAGLPGGLVAPSETADQAAMRHLALKARVGADHVYIEQLYTFSAIHRDPNGRVVAVAYLGLVPWHDLKKPSQENTVQSWWTPIHKLPKLAYDHREIIHIGIERLRSRVTNTSLIAKLMPREFTLTELEEMYESILGKVIDKRNFRKKVLKQGVLQELPRVRTGEKHRPAKLYKFRSFAVVPTVMI